jgi:hypothetical protein
MGFRKMSQARPGLLHEEERKKERSMESVVFFLT